MHLTSSQSISFKKLETILPYQFKTVQTFEFDLKVSLDHPPPNPPNPGGGKARSTYTF